MLRKFKVALALTAFSLSFAGPGTANVASGGAVPPALKISGNSIFVLSLPAQKKRDNGKGYHAFHAYIPVSDLIFLVQGKASNGFEYGYLVSLDAYPGSSPTVAQNFIEFKRGDFGIFLLGAVAGPEDTMIKDGNTIAAATGGPDGSYKDVFNFPSLCLYGNDVIGDTGFATKVVYYTPIFYGVQFGFAYTPNTAHQGDGKLNTHSKGGNDSAPGNRGFPDKSVYPFGLRNFVLGMSYKVEACKWSFTATGAMVSDKSYITSKRLSRIRLHNTFAYQLGAVLGYKTTKGLIQFGGGYLNNHKSRMDNEVSASVINQLPGGLLAGGTNDYSGARHGRGGKAWNLGTAYSFGPYKVSATYQRTHRRTGKYTYTVNNVVHNMNDHATLDVCSVGGEISPVQGLKFFSEVNYIRGKTNARAMALEQAILTRAGSEKRAVGSNIGTVVNAGVKVSF